MSFPNGLRGIDERDLCADSKTVLESTSPETTKEKFDP